MRRKYAALAVLLFIVSLFAIGCPGKNSSGPEETIIFQNRSGYNGVNCYIDFVFKGVVNNGQDLYVQGDHEGNVVLSADGPGRWGPNTYFINDGGTFIWTMTR